MNPGCDLIQCRTPGNPAIFYGNHFIGDDTIHILYSSLDELTISVIQTRKGYGPHINYTELFNHNYNGSIGFGDTAQLNSFSLIIRRLMKFNDTNNTGDLNKNQNSIESYWLNGLTTNITRRDNNTVQPSFQLPLDDVNILFFQQIEVLFIIFRSMVY
jgi:hypothetical protein